MPVVPQVLCAVATQRPCETAPLYTSLHVPSDPARSHAVQAPVQALSQHLPWAQWALEHSVSPEQSAPRGLGPHELMLPFMPQLLGGMHCSLVVQAPKHLVALQWYGLHGNELGWMHCPDALLVDGPVQASSHQTPSTQCPF